MRINNVILKMEKVIFLCVILFMKNCYSNDFHLMNDEELKNLKENNFSLSVDFDNQEGKKYDLEGNVYLYDAYYSTKIKLYNKGIYYNYIYRVLKHKINIEDLHYQSEISKSLYVYLGINNYDFNKKQKIKVNENIKLENIPLLATLFKRAKKLKYRSGEGIELSGDWSYFVENNNRKIEIIDVISEKNGIYSLYTNVMNETEVESSAKMLLDITNSNIKICGWLQ